MQRSPQLNPNEAQSPSLVPACSQVITTYTDLYFCDINIEEVCEVLLSCSRPPCTLAIALVRLLKVQMINSDLPSAAQVPVKVRLFLDNLERALKTVVPGPA